MQYLEEDVLSGIFILTVSQSEGRPTLRCAPLNLSHTCRAWRKLLLSSGRFWTHLDCYNLGSYDHRLASLWPERSRDAIMHVQIGPHHDGSEESKDTDCAKLAEATFRHQRWIGTLKLVTTGPHQCQPTELHDLSNLLSLELHHSFPFREDSQLLSSANALFLIRPLSETCQAIAPKLTKLALTGVKDATAQRTGILSMLKNCTSLVELALTTRRNRPSERQEEETEALIDCILEKLETLSYSTFFYQGILQHIRAPSLQNLCVMGIATRPSTFNELYRDLREFLANSNHGPSVRSARFFFSHINEDDQLAILEALPDLKILEATFPRTNRVFRALTRASGRDELCPRLESLDIHAPPKEGVAAMIDMLQSRFDHHSEAFQAVVAMRPISDEDVQALRSHDEVHRWIFEGRLNGPRALESSRLYDRFVAAQQGLRFRF